MFTELINKLKPANKHYNYMDIKELSEIMEARYQEAAPYVMAFFRAQKEYEKACKIAMEQCSMSRSY